MIGWIVTEVLVITICLIRNATTAQLLYEEIISLKKYALIMSLIQKVSVPNVFLL
jgi:hypothetical protein